MNTTETTLKTSKNRQIIITCFKKRTMNSHTYVGKQSNSRTRFRIICFCVAICFFAHISIAESLGRFKGELILKVSPDGRLMELVRPFTYIDSHHVTWFVPAHTQIDGASIPRIFWSMIGGPFTGKYREASVIHDHYCATKSRHWKAVHRVFLDGMLARGVDKIKAQLMYLAVYRFGPKWDFEADACFCKGCPPCAVPKLKHISIYDPKYKEEDFKELQSKLLAGRFSLEDIEIIADYQLNTEILKSFQ